MLWFSTVPSCSISNVDQDSENGNSFRLFHKFFLAKCTQVDKDKGTQKTNHSTIPLQSTIDSARLVQLIFKLSMGDKHALLVVVIVLHLSPIKIYHMLVVIDW